MKIKVLGCAVAMLMVCSALAIGQNPPPAATPRSSPTTPTALAVPENAALLMQRTGGSLLRASMAAQPDPAQAKLSAVSFFAVPPPKPKTIKPHDLVTIIIREESEFSSEASTDTKRSSDLEAKVDQWIGLNLKNLAILGGAEGATPPGVKVGASRNFKGEATVDRSDSFIARIQAEVVDVKPNGTLILQARKKITTDEEVQQFILTGICRADDVTADNSVLSTQLFDLNLQKKHNGAVYDSTKRGVAHKLLDFVNAF